MNEFKKRIEYADILTDFFNDFLKENKISYFESGYEFYKSNQEALEKIKFKNDVTSKFIRYYPDYTIVGKNKSILIDAKNSSGIEKECYENYKNLEYSCNINLLLLLKNKKLCKLQDLKFYKPDVFDAKSNRMGFLLEGTPIHLSEPKQYVSSAVTMGTLQLLPNGQIIVLMADHQTIGGYANLGQIILVDLPRLAQLNNHSHFKLSITNVQTAHQLYRSIQSWFIH